jgi:predicted  nucleic acid-binding Zn-ribbon protein
MMRDQIKKLIELQKVDSEIYDLKVKLKEKPEFIAQLKSEFEKNLALLSGLEGKLKRIQLDRKSLELELKTKEEGIAKANAKLSEIRTNKEYSAKLSEIESIKADKSIFEEKILVSYDAADAVQKEIDRERGVVAEKEKSFLSKNREVEDEVKVMEDRIKVLGAQRRQALDGVDPNCLGRYEKILRHKDGLAIASLLGNSCGGCFMNVTQQQINTIKMHDQLVVCEMCQRILYIEDDL